MAPENTKQGEHNLWFGVLMVLEERFLEIAYIKIILIFSYIANLVMVIGLLMVEEITKASLILVDSQNVVPMALKQSILIP